MRYLAGLSLLAALVLAAPETQAFTLDDQGATNNPAPKSNDGATNNSAAKKSGGTATNAAPANSGATPRNYGSTLTTPGPGWSLGDAIATTPSANSAETPAQKSGFSFQVRPQSNGFGMNQRPPAWSTDPLYRERGE